MAFSGEEKHRMEELWELRGYIEAGNTAAALALLDEMEEMSRDDKAQKIKSFMRVLLTHIDFPNEMYIIASTQGGGHDKLRYNH
jgi:hypothetical protein